MNSDFKAYRLHIRSSMLAMLLCALVLGACRAPWDSAKAERAQAATVQIMDSLQPPDLLRYRALTLPPKQLAQLQSDWPAIRSKFALSKSEQETFNELLLRFTEPDAEHHLQRDLNAKIRPINSEIVSKWPLMQTSLTLLLQGWIETNQQLSRSEKDHGKALVEAIIEQMPAQWLQDKALRQRAFDQMVWIARSSGLQNYNQYNKLDFQQFHGTLAEFLAGLKDLGKIYGLDWNAGQAKMQVKVLQQSGARAKVQVRYPLGQKWVEFNMDLIEKDGHWYDESALKLFHDKLSSR